MCCTRSAPKVVDQYLPIFEMTRTTSYDGATVAARFRPEEVARIFGRNPRSNPAVPESARSRPSWCESSFAATFLHQRRNDTIFPRRRGPCPPRAVHNDGLLLIPSTALEAKAAFWKRKRRGVVTRQLAAWAAILAVPSSVAGNIWHELQALRRNWTRHMAAVVSE